MFVRSRMTTNPFIISPDHTIPDAQEIMMKNGIRRLPVVKNGKLVGVVTKEDIDRYSPSQATSLSMSEITYILSKTKIKQIMTKDPVVISPNALLEEAAILMRDQRVGFLPVVDGDKLVGIITESDIFDAFIELLGFRERGTRLTIETIDEPGILLKLISIFTGHGANITRVAVYRGSGGKSDVVVGISSLNTTEIEKSIEEEGFNIRYKLQNK
ncbi:MAG: CBS domain-containing protein [Clostridiales bacterium]|jgi:acetoin utilization protein AcuB|nr:CBS domain-containing protein [Clostridiales bacterium]